MSGAAGFSGNSGAAVMVGKPGVHCARTGWRHRNRRGAAFHCMAFAWAGGNWRWYDANNKRNISGVLGKYGTSVNSAAARSGCSAVSDSRTQKKAKLSDAIPAVFAGSLSAAAHMRKTKVQGSLTIEAALVMPLVLLVFGLAMSSGIMLYTECRDTSADIQEEKEFDAVEAFYRWQGIGDMIGDGNSIY